MPVAKSSVRSYTDMKTAGQIGRRAGTGSLFHGIPEGLHSSACRNGTRQVQVSHLGWFLLFQTRTSNMRPLHVIKTRSEPEQPLEGWLVLRRCVSVWHSGTVWMRRLILKAAIKAEQLSTECLCEAKTQGHGSWPGHSLWWVCCAGTQERVRERQQYRILQYQKNSPQTVLRLKTTLHIFGF